MDLQRNRDLPPVPPLIKSPDLPSPTSPMENFPRTPLQTLSFAASLFAKNDALFDVSSSPSKKEERMTRGGLYDEPFSAGTPAANGFSPPDSKKPKLDFDVHSKHSKMAVNGGVPPPLRGSPGESQVPFPANLSPKSCPDSDADYKEERMSPSPPASPYGHSTSPSQRGCDSPMTRRRNSTSSTDSGTEEGKDGKLRNIVTC